MTPRAQFVNGASSEDRVLLLTPTGRDSVHASSTLLEAGIPTRVCSDVLELCDVVRNGGAAVLVIAVEGLDGGNHVPLVDLLAEQPAWSDLPVVLLTAGGEGTHTLLRDYLTAGGSTTFLERPFRAMTLVSVVKVGIRARRRQYELRDAISKNHTLLREAEIARAEAEHAGHMKDEFLATLSHELRTPLNAILGWAQLLRHGTRAAGDYQEGLDVIERNARSQTQLIEDLLDMSRIIAGKVRLDVQLLNPATFLELAVETMRPAAEAKDIRLVKVLDPSAGPVTGDAARLQQVVWNLLTNAIKFTPKGGKVQVALGRVNSHVEISIADTGQGITPEFLPHVFDRFRQADGSTTRRTAGLGLGLSIVRQLVELHGGSVRADSSGDGKGSTFTIDLPLAIVRAESSRKPRVHPRASSSVPFDCEAQSLKGITVLVVDDEPDARGLVRRVLEECHAKVLTAASAEDAMSVLAEETPDVLLSDIGMPDADGYELLRRVRAAGVKIPAIALTAFARSEDRIRALRSGFSVHVSKPVEPEELLAAVANAAGLSHDVLTATGGGDTRPVSE